MELLKDDIRILQGKLLLLKRALLEAGIMDQVKKTL